MGFKSRLTKTKEESHLRGTLLLFLLVGVAGHGCFASCLLDDRYTSFTVPVCASTSLKTIINRFLHALPFAVPDIYLRGINPLPICRPLHNPAPSLHLPPAALRLGSLLGFKSRLTKTKEESHLRGTLLLFLFGRSGGT